jgi:hypothetical protein
MKSLAVVRLLLASMTVIVAVGAPTAIAAEASTKFIARDFTGIWVGPFPSGDDPAQAIPFTPEYREKSLHWRAALLAGHPYASAVVRCEAFGMPYIMGFGPFFEFLQSPRQLTIITEALHEVRRIYLDGRAHPADFDPGFDGHSVGHWEGNTLVVDTIGIKANNDSSGIFLSDHLHVVEHITRTGPDSLRDVLTSNDPEALTRPWDMTVNYTRAPAGTEISEYICTNNRNLPDANGATTAQ